MKNKSINNSVYLIIAVFLASFLSIDLQNIASLSLIQSTASSYSLYVFLLFVSSLLYTYLNRRYINRRDNKSLRRFMFAVYGISIFFSFFFSLGNKISYILIILPYIMFLYMYVSCCIISDKVRHISIVSIFVFLIYVYIQEYTKVIAFSFNQDATTNASYFILYLLPLVLCVDKKWIRILAVIVTIIVVVSSSKRGGTIAIILASLTYFLVEYLLIKEKVLNFGIVFLCLTIMILVVYGEKYIQGLTVFGRMENLVDDEGSGRLDIFRHTYLMISDSGFFNLVLGHGWNRVVSDSALKLSAHNDFLEVFYDFGLLGFTLYLSLYVFLIKRTIALIKHKSCLAPAMTVSIVLFFVNSCVSHIVIYPAYMCLFTICWGYILSLERRRLTNVA